MLLDSDEQEQNEIKDLQMQLSETTSLVKTLSKISLTAVFASKYVYFS